MGSRPKRAAVGWHGIVPTSIEVDWRLAAELSPEGQAVKVIVDARSPARKAGLRTGDYVVSVSPSPTDDMSLGDFDGRNLPPGTDVYVKFHRPRKGKTRDVEIAAVRLRKRTLPPQAPKWQQTPRVALGPKVERDDRSRFEAQMATHPQMAPLGFQILVRLLRHYDGPNGAYPSYSTLARDVGRKRRAVINHIARLEWIGVLEVVRAGGVRKQGGFTNQFIIHWPDGWGCNVVKLPRQK